MRLLALSACVWLTVVASGFAQGVQTGTITGTVQSSDSLSLPGVTVTASSPALQGRPTAVTDVNGVYFIKGLPAGTYVVQFDIVNFQPAKQENVALTVGGTAEVNTTMQLAARTEAITVIAEAPSPLATVTLSQAYTKAQVDALPISRRPQDIAELSPGLSNNTPNTSQVTISGATAFDNVFMLNGVDIDCNLFGSPNNLFIEDAIQETNVLTGGISAEWGRFSGGVINLVTKSGGNAFTGSFRENFSNPKWIAKTPREEANNVSHADVLSKVSEGTFGGPIVKDRLWFFTAGRYQKDDTPNTFVQTGGAYTRSDINKRGEVKFTATVANGHRISADYLNNSTVQNNRPSLNASVSLDPTTLVTATQPNALFVTNYNGVWGGKYYATLQYSQKQWEVQGSGGTSTAIKDSPFRTRGVLSGVPSSLHYAAPFFSALDPEDRNNHQFTGSLSHTLSSKRFGTHDLKGGGEYYRSTRMGGNSQSATNYVFQTDYLVTAGQPVVDAQGVPVPVFQPDLSRVQNWIPTIGAVININTTSLYFQDRWVATPRVTLDLGTRFEAVRSHATGDIVTVDTTRIVPRLGVAFDVEGNGRTIAQATYAHYSGKYSEVQYSANTDVANPSRVTYGYTGPIGQGRDFAPGFNLSNYTSIVSASFPTANISVASGVKSPVVREFTLALGRELGRQKGYVKATYEWRHWYQFLEDFINLGNGIVNVNRNGASVGNLTNVVFNNTDAIDRDYQALILQHSYRFRSNVIVAAHYTLQIRNNGNSNAEAGNQPGLSSLFGDYPEVLGPALDRYLPEGRLASYQRHKLRVYGTYAYDIGRYGLINVSPIWRVNSGQVYSLSAANVRLSAIELARNPGYPANDINPLVSETLYFGARGSQDFKGYGLLDLATTYELPVWKTARPWVKVEFYNILNNRKQIGWDTTVTPDASSPKDANGLPTGYIPGPRFGQATNDNQFPQPVPGQNGGRLFRTALGFRF